MKSPLLVTWSDTSSNAPGATRNWPEPLQRLLVAGNEFGIWKTVNGSMHVTGAGRWPTESAALPTCGVTAQPIESASGHTSEPTMRPIENVALQACVSIIGVGMRPIESVALPTCGATVLPTESASSHTHEPTTRPIESVVLPICGSTTQAAANGLRSRRDAGMQQGTADSRAYLMRQNIRHAVR